MPFIGIVGGQLHFRLDGPSEAPVLVMSNSLGTNLTLWHQQAALFARQFRVVRYDSRGHGQSSATPGPYSIELLGRCVVDLLNHLQVSAAHFCGLSLGGMVGIWFAVHQPDRIRKLVLANTAAWLGPAEAWNARIDAVRRGGLAAIAENVIQRWFTPAFRERLPQEVERARELLLATPPEGYAASCAAIRDIDQWADVGKIASPTLVIAGQQDRATPPDGCRALSRAIRGAAYVELCAAHLSNVEAGEAFNSVVLDFLLS